MIEIPVAAIVYNRVYNRMQDRLLASLLQIGYHEDTHELGASLTGLPYMFFAGAVSCGNLSDVAERVATALEFEIKRVTQLN